MASAWRGGSGDAGLHERAPYWLNGFVPLAYLLKNANVTALPGAKGLYHQKTSCGALSRPAADCEDLPPVKPLEQVHRFISEVLARRQPSGWLGPDDPPPKPNPGDKYWSASNMLIALWQYAEAEPSMFDQVSEAIVGHLLELQRRLASVPLGGWSFARWVDLAYTVEVMLGYPQAIKGNKVKLEELLHTVQQQGQDWDSDFAEAPARIASQHNVNVAQGIKSAAVEYLASDGSNSSYYGALSRERLHALDEYFGVASGAFLGDEELPVAPLHNPSRGSELCQIVESMLSYEIMFSAHGDVAFADRVERLAYNAFPSTWASPRGGDMWAHQYLQSVNQIQAIKSIPHIWPNDGEFAEIYGLSPNYGCCTANFNQGWPKFANSLVYTVERKGEEGMVIALWAPASVTTRYGDVDIDTNYPFGDVATVTVSAAKPTFLYMRIPAWAVHAEVAPISGSVANGTMVKVPVPIGGLQVKVLFRPDIRVEKHGGFAGGAPGPASYSVYRGPLMYSLPLRPDFTSKDPYIPDEGAWTIPGAHDYEIRSTTTWAYALDVDEENPSKYMKFEDSGYHLPNAPFNWSAPTSRVIAQMRPLGEALWREVNNSASPPPASPACAGVEAADCGKPIKLALVPHGATVLRIGSLPLSGLGTEHTYAADVGTQFV
eukprot:TRINITY_DN55319_c0_g1_i1.p1 TRINITY_DN55319_c0_g1~~TRINITY_DN55319_c0_g1_i1.p1  ORF type:complete len:731 (-),score=94.73 TRINITY_DN55319_c0_g1_i1:36-2015(-)